MKYLVCADCDYRIPEQRFQGKYRICPRCQFGLRLSDIGQESESESRREICRPVFTGTAGEYFRIWIVNTFLTILTLGIYAAWAKVRTRRYFYANTLLAGHPFDYKANPVEILKGNLVVGAGFIVYMFCRQSYPTTGIGVLIVFYIFLPFLVYKSLRFNLHNSAFRNIRFRFLGGLGESYHAWLFIPLLIPPTFGLIVPYWAFRRNKYYFGNIAYGETVSVFNGFPKRFYSVYAAAIVLCVVCVSALALLGYLAVDLLDLGHPVAFPFFLIPFIYSAALVVYTTIEQFIYAKLANHSWNHTRLGDITFESTLSARRLMAIRITNVLAILFSLGLLVPWAKVRRTKYILANIAVRAETGLDEFAAVTESDESAYGDAATDFIDFEIGL